MNKVNKLALFIVAGVLIMGAGYLILQAGNLTILNPKGLIADKQRDLMVFTTLLSFLVVIPVFILTFTIAWKYRASNVAARYTPDWDHNRRLEFIWWGIPCAVILVLSFVTWQSSHALDPAKPLASTANPIKIQVVALQWKWLFIYPDYGIASVNYIRFPAEVPVNFQITADAPMNSFWIPELGGQIYAMPGMSTKLHLMANDNGVYNGSSANLSGKGFAGMKFKAESSSQTDFEQWIKTARQSPLSLNLESYSKLAAPSENNSQAVYVLSQDKLYDTVIMKYMMPAHPAASNSSTSNAGTMHGTLRH